MTPTEDRPRSHQAQSVCFQVSLEMSTSHTPVSPHQQVRTVGHDLVRLTILRASVMAMVPDPRTNVSQVQAGAGEAGLGQGRAPGPTMAGPPCPGGGGGARAHRSLLRVGKACWQPTSHVPTPVTLSGDPRRPDTGRRGSS